MVNNEAIETYPLLKDENNVLPENSLYAGSLNIKLPDPNQNKKIQINVSAGYEIISYTGSTVPYPPTTTEEILINII